MKGIKQSFLKEFLSSPKLRERMIVSPFIKVEGFSDAKKDD